MSADVKNNLITLIHIAKKDMSLTDVRYRAILQRATGQKSCRDCDLLQLGQAFDALRRFAVSSGQRDGWRKPSKRKQVRLIFALWWDLGRSGKLRTPMTEWNCCLRKFVKGRTGVEDPEWLPPALASKVITILKSWNRRPARIGPSPENADPEAA